MKNILNLQKCVFGTIAVAILAASINSYATDRDCTLKIKEFAERITTNHLDISINGKYTSVEYSADSKSSTVTITSDLGMNRQLKVKLGPGVCSITGVESLDSELF